MRRLWWLTTTTSSIVITGKNLASPTMQTGEACNSRMENTRDSESPTAARSPPIDVLHTASVCANLWQTHGSQYPFVTVVEPEAADCLFQSARAGMPWPSSG